MKISSKKMEILKESIAWEMSALVGIEMSPAPASQPFRLPS